MIHLEQIYKSYQTATVETTALENINIQIEKGNFVSVMGPSGCGKTTLLNVMGLLDQPDQGIIRIDNQEVGHWKDKKLANLRNRKIGFIFQSFHLIQPLNVLDNVELPLLYRNIHHRERRKIAMEVLDRVGLGHRTRHFPAELSGGQSQRVAIARALAGSPEIILADEPTGNLDSKMGEEVMELLAEINRETQTTIVMVTHDRQMAEKTQRIIHLFDGRQVN